MGKLITVSGKALGAMWTATGPMRDDRKLATSLATAVDGWLASGRLSGYRFPAPDMGDERVRVYTS
jgi:hypothetical protein